MLERFKELASNLRKAEAKVDEGYKEYFASRAEQVECWVRLLERGDHLDVTYALECARGFEAVIA